MSRFGQGGACLDDVGTRSSAEPSQVLQNSGVLAPRPFAEFITRSKDVPVYVLSTTATGCGHGCRYCNACRRHADNKVFASKAAVFRAHPKCDCVIVQRSLPQGTWTAVFGNP